MRTTGQARVLAAMGLAGAVALTACQAPEDAEAPDDNGEEVTDLRLGTGSVGGTYYPLGGEIAQIWSDNIDGVSVDTQETGASVENLRNLDNGDNELIMSVNGTAEQGFAGTVDFEDEPLENPDEIVFLGNIYPEVMQLVVRADSGIESVADLEDAAVEIGPVGSGTEGLSTRILEAYGIDPDSGIDPYDSDFGEAATALGDGTVDAAFGILSVPASGIEEAGASTDIDLVNIDGPEADALMEDDPTLSSYVIDGGTYSGIDDDVTVLTNWASLYARADLDEDLAYDLVQVMYENQGDIGHAVGEQVQLDTSIDGLAEIPLHPGAERYYEEQGLL
ncbi:TAXI family TRAP transporter solute-binding subunit [Spiractinospora alimapuensis]|uniref:TAXI family TRAP transporter solute-binding subunit n=1 Tax=Spiractinospora alimapuensis TaxID=2820884 RepID=UPI001F2AA3E3|nr:TAXI family TRAP transporter solute-binding subunit [Spiractinospora alimapuensis]